MAVCRCLGRISGENNLLGGLTSDGPLWPQRSRVPTAATGCTPYLLRLGTSRDAEQASRLGQGGGVYITGPIPIRYLLVLEGKGLPQSIPGFQFRFGAPTGPVTRLCRGTVPVGVAELEPRDGESRVHSL